MENDILFEKGASVFPEIIEASCLFQQPYWLEAVAPGRWGAASVSKGGSITARLPYVVENKFGLTRLTTPKLTKFLGPWLAPASGKYASDLSRQKDLLMGLIAQLPPHEYFSQNFHYTVTNWLPFFWKGFTQTTLYSYVLDDLTNEETLWSGLQGNIRREIRKAGKQVEVRDDLGLDCFLELNTATFVRKGVPLPFSHDYVRRIDDVLKQKNQRRILFAVDAQKRVHASLYIIWDSVSAFYLMGGGDQELRTSGSTSLLIWEAIRFASAVTKAFDFEGSMIESVERFFRSFGARQQPYFRVTFMSRKMKNCVFWENILGRSLKQGNRYVKVIKKMFLNGSAAR